MHFSTACEWLDYIKTINIHTIELGLTRVTQVAERMGLFPINCPTVLVGGTNGKGSVVAALESIYKAAGLSVGAYTSPMLLIHNDQVRLNGVYADDNEFCLAFQFVEEARADSDLTAFEFFTLAALKILIDKQPDVLILEMGLGGRLDAVNIIDADVSVITSIALDHQEWLGDTREKIATEKAGIYRPFKPAICGDPNPPPNLKLLATNVQANFLQQGEDFYYEQEETNWRWYCADNCIAALPYNGLLLQNMSSALMVVNALQTKLPITIEFIRKGLAQVAIQGRLQFVPGIISEVHDVSHNPHAIKELANYLQKQAFTKTHAVFSMLSDKDIKSCVTIIKPYIDSWHIAEIADARAAKLETLIQIFSDEKIQISTYDSLAIAYQAAIKSAKTNESVLVFGSFHTLAEVLRYTESEHSKQT